MRDEEFRERLGRLQEVLSRGLLYYGVWKNLVLHDPSKVSWSLEEQNKVLGRYHGFFTPVALALRDMALMEFSKAFDKRGRTASLRNLLRTAKQNATLIPHAGEGDMDEVCARLEASEPVLMRLKKMRDQQLAHAYPEPLSAGPIRNTDLDKLADDAVSAFNLLAKAHDDRFVSWEYALRTTEQGTTAILRILREEIASRQKQHDDEMVRIGLEEARHREAVMGRRLDGEELWSVKQSFGLTDEQMQRIEERYGSA